MAIPPPPWTLGQLAEQLNGELSGPAEKVIQSLASADSEDRDALCLAESAKYIKLAEAGAIGALLIPKNGSTDKPHIKVESPRLAFFLLLQAASKPLDIAAGVHPTAVIDPAAQVHPTARVGAYAVVAEGAILGEDSEVYALAFVGPRCELGKGSRVLPHAVLVQDVLLGEGGTVHSGAVVGGDGFGYQFDGERQVKIPHVGKVRIGSNAEVGSLAAVDRAKMGETLLSDGVKIDNFVQIAHNVRVGEHTVIAAHGGIAGSATIGKRVSMAGKVDVGDHMSVCDDAILGGRTGVAQSIEQPGVYFGTPARPIREAQRAMMATLKLPELMSKVKELEARLAALEGK